MRSIRGHFVNHPPRKFLAYSKVVATALILGSVVYLLGPVAIVGSAQRVEVPWIAAACVLVGPIIFVQWNKWHLLVQNQISGCSSRSSLNSLFVGFALGMASPGRLGEVGRGVFMEGDRFEISVLAALDRTISFAATMLLASVSAVILFPRMGLIAVAVSMAAVAVIWIMRRRLVALLSRSTRGRRAVAVVGSVSRRLWIRVVFFSVLFNLIFCAQFYLLLHSWGPVDAKAVWAIPLIFGLKSLLPIAFMDLGVREGAAVLVFTMLELEPVPAFGAAVILVYDQCAASGHRRRSAHRVPVSTCIPDGWKSKRAFHQCERYSVGYEAVCRDDHSQARMPFPTTS